MATVLLVEDNEDVRDMMSMALQLVGHRVLAARHGRDALELLGDHPSPCLILLDLMMPVMDGWELRALLRRDPRFAKIPVVVVSALTTETAARLGAAAYLPKPIDVDQLLEVVCEHCRR